MRLLLGLILSFFTFSSFADSKCGDGNLIYACMPTPGACESLQPYLEGKRNRFKTIRYGSGPIYVGFCLMNQAVQCRTDQTPTIGEYGVNYGCEDICQQGYTKDQGGICRDPNGCTEDQFSKNGQCSDRCAEYGSNASGYNMQTHDCNFNQQCGAMQKRDRFNLSSSTGLGSGACYDDPNGCPSGYAWHPSTNGGADACRSFYGNDINSICPSGTKIVGDGSTGQCQADGSQNSQNSSSTSTSSGGSSSGASSGAISSSSGIPGSTSSSGGSTGGDNGGSGSSQGPGDGLTSSSSSGGTSGATSGSSGSSGTSASSSGSTGGLGGLSSSSSSGGQTGGYSGRCDIPPQCQNSASIECAQLYQTWFAGCPLKGYTHQTYVEPVEDGKAKVRELFDGFKTRVSAAPVVEGFSNFVKFNRTGSCPTWPIDIGWFTATFDYLCSPIIPWGIISGVLIACSLLIAFRLAAK